MDCYAILGVSKDSSKEEIKQAYRKRALETHPDKSGNNEEFLKVQAAYEMLISQEGIEIDYEKMQYFADKLNTKTEPAKKVKKGTTRAELSSILDKMLEKPRTKSKVFDSLQEARDYVDQGNGEYLLRGYGGTLDEALSRLEKRLGPRPS